MWLTCGRWNVTFFPWEYCVFACPVPNFNWIWKDTLLPCPEKDQNMSNSILNVAWYNFLLCWYLFAVLCILHVKVIVPKGCVKMQEQIQLNVTLTNLDFYPKACLIFLWSDVTSLEFTLKVSVDFPVCSYTSLPSICVLICQCVLSSQLWTSKSQLKA